jgi:hypothetical protein
MLAWNRVLTSSMSIFQTSCEHVLVALAVCAWRAVWSYLALIVAIVLLLLQERTRRNNYHYRHRHYIVIHQQPFCVVWRQNISSGPYAFFHVSNPRNVLFWNVAQPVARATVPADVCPTWRDITQAVGCHHISVSLMNAFYRLRQYSVAQVCPAKRVILPSFIGSPPGCSVYVIYLTYLLPYGF